MKVTSWKEKFDNPVSCKQIGLYINPIYPTTTRIAADTMDRILMFRYLDNWIKNTTIKKHKEGCQTLKKRYIKESPEEWNKYRAMIKNSSHVKKLKRRIKKIESDIKELT